MVRPPPLAFQTHNRFLFQKFNSPSSPLHARTFPSAHRAAGDSMRATNERLLHTLLASGEYLLS